MVPMHGRKAEGALSMNRTPSSDPSPPSGGYQFSVARFDNLLYRRL